MANFSIDLALNLERSFRACGIRREASFYTFVSGILLCDRKNVHLCQIERAMTSTKMQWIRVMFVLLRVGIGAEMGLHNGTVIVAMSLKKFLWSEQEGFQLFHSIRCCASCNGGYKAIIVFWVTINNYFNVVSNSKKSSNGCKRLNDLLDVKKIRGDSVIHFLVLS